MIPNGAQKGGQGFRGSYVLKRASAVRNVV